MDNNVNILNKSTFHLPISNLENVDLSKLSENERFRLEHQRMHEKHRGHETMHAEMVFILLVTLILAQVVLVQWKAKHFKSYQLATLIGMWIVPFGISVHFRWYRFLIIWTVYSLLSLYVAMRVTRKPISMKTPRAVYTWFVSTYKLSYAIGIIGYVLIMFTFLGINVLLRIPPHIMMDIGLHLLFYGLYFGVIGRDFAEVCTHKMAAHVGYYTPSGIPTKHLEPGVCAVCGQKVLEQPRALPHALVDQLTHAQYNIDDDDDDDYYSEGNSKEKIYRLDCNHVFHEFCIRGWCIVGKKQTCPYCKEKVDLKRMFASPWAKADLMYGNMLDWIRFMVAWQPLIVLLVQAINWVLGLE